ncbi:hypothetical protein GQ602_007043 [Ophiocordyceps camponoti-floridani]|uniref:Uncharacterized protein n=1 Tax=Ophiocordyceps camponoti-floridani TaxID=2030778 RepID=A0A8H4VAE1_9HYPO|nr:hypothetical protein GQ602_007043 [Ophiocordyceps camponoti-floridani]
MPSSQAKTRGYSYVFFGETFSVRPFRPLRSCLDSGPQSTLGTLSLLHSRFPPRRQGPDPGPNSLWLPPLLSPQDGSGAAVRASSAVLCRPQRFMMIDAAND